jgi:predicted dehydrogenase
MPLLNRRFEKAAINDGTGVVTRCGYWDSVPKLVFGLFSGGQGLPSTSSPSGAFARGISNRPRTDIMSLDNEPRSGRACKGVILFGTGKHASSVLLPPLRASQLPLVLVNRTTPESVLRDALGNAAMDCAIVATRHDSHFELTLCLLKAGKRVLCEKPLVVSGKELAALSRLASTHPGMLATGHNRRYAPLAQKLRDMTRKLVSGEGQSPSSLFIDYAVSSPTPSSPPHWSWEAAQGGGPLLAEATHFIDLILWLADDRPLVSWSVLLVGQWGFVLSMQLCNCGATLRYGTDKSLGAVKEVITVSASDGHQAVLYDFERLVMDSKKEDAKKDKGWDEEVRRFLAGRLQQSLRHQVRNVY